MGKSKNMSNQDNIIKKDKRPKTADKVLN